MYQGIGVFDLQENGTKVLAMCVSKNSVALQVWTWGKDAGCYEKIRKFLINEVQSIQQRYRINISYVIKLKCPRGLYYKPSDKKEIIHWIRESSSKCSSDECSEIHKSDDIYGKWYKLIPETYSKSDDKHENKDKRYACHVCGTGLSILLYWCNDCQDLMCENCNKHKHSDDNYRHNLQLVLYRCHVCDKEQSVYWCHDCQKSMCDCCNNHHRESEATNPHILQHVQDTYSMDYNFKVNAVSLYDIKMLHGELLVIADYFGERLVTCHILGSGKQQTIPLPGKPRCIAVDDNTVAVTLDVGSKPIKVALVDIKQRKVIKLMTFTVGCSCIMYREKQLFIGCRDKTILVRDLSRDVYMEYTIEVGTIPSYIYGGKAGSLYYTSRDKLYCIDTAGKSFVFSNPDMRKPLGITTDDDEHILVICYDSRNVLRISPDFKQSQIIITQIPSFDTSSVYYDSLSKSLVIGRGKNVYVYKKI